MWNWALVAVNNNDNPKELDEVLTLYNIKETIIDRVEFNVVVIEDEINLKCKELMNPHNWIGDVQGYLKNKQMEMHLGQREVVRSILGLSIDTINHSKSLGFKVTTFKNIKHWNYLEYQVLQSAFDDVPITNHNKKNIIPSIYFDIDKTVCIMEEKYNSLSPNERKTFGAFSGLNTGIKHLIDLGQWVDLSDTPADKANRLIHNFADTSQYQNVTYHLIELTGNISNEKCDVVIHLPNKISIEIEDEIDF